MEEVDEGQPCLTCQEKCSGFAPHLWRWVTAYLCDGLFRLGFWTDHRMCSSFKLLGRPKVLCCFEAFLGRCPIVMHDILCCSCKTKSVNNLSNVCASRIVSVMKWCDRTCRASVRLPWFLFILWVCQVYCFRLMSANINVILFGLFY